MRSWDSPNFDMPSSNAGSVMLLLARCTFPFDRNRGLGKFSFGSLFGSAVNYSYIDSVHVMRFYRVAPPM